MRIVIVHYALAILTKIEVAYACYNSMRTKKDIDE